MTMRPFASLAFAGMFASLAAACGSQITTGEGGGGDESGSLDNTAADRSAESAIVGQKAKVTASALNLRTGPSTSNAIIAVMPSGAVVDVSAAQNGWYKVSWNGKVGWCSGLYLTPVSSPTPPPQQPGNTPVEQAIARAESGVGFSYHWGGGCWSPGGSPGACYGSCPNCTHSGTWGADCSGYVAKVWQVPGASALTTCSHPYSTYNFRFEQDHWSPVSRSNARRGDALVYHSGSEGHIFVFDSGDPWGYMKAYEAKGCSYGIQHDTRNASSAYIAIRREGF
jgi:cell wall-associated NlpC family hydrolase